MGDDAQTIKKGPGRPRKEKTSKNKKIQGIMSAPITEDPNGREINMELEYDNSSLFKKSLFSLYKNEGVRELTIRFEAEEIKFIGKNHLGNSNLITTLYGNKMSYYCKSPYLIKIAYENIKSAFNSIGKDHIKIYIRSYEHEKRRNINIVLEKKNKKLSTFKINLAEYSDNINANEEIDNFLNEEETYPLNFKIDSREFRSEIQTISNMNGEIITIKKLKDKSLSFNVDSDDNFVKYDANFGDEENMDVVYKPQDTNELALMVEIQISNMKPISSSIISKYIYFSIDNNKPLIFTIYLDEDIDKNKEPVRDSAVGNIKILAPIKKF